MYDVLLTLTSSQNKRIEGAMLLRTTLVFILVDCVVLQRIAYRPVVRARLLCNGRGREQTPRADCSTNRRQAVPESDLSCRRTVRTSGISDQRQRHLYSTGEL